MRPGGVTPAGRRIAVVATGLSGQSWNAKIRDETDIEVWTCTGAYQKVPRSDRHFELHAWRSLPKAYGEEWEPLYKPFIEKHQSLYVRESNPGWPDATLYPADRVMAIWRRLLMLDDGERDYFVSTVGWMLALAGIEGREYNRAAGKITEIFLIGVNMEVAEEYGHQKPNAEALIYALRMRGIRVHIPDDSPLCKAPLYEFGQDSEAIAHYQSRMKEIGKRKKDALDAVKDVQTRISEMQMILGGKDEITRDALETRLAELQPQLDNFKGAANEAQGRISELDGLLQEATGRKNRPIYIGTAIGGAL